MPTARRCASATSTWRPTRRGAAPSTARVRAADGRRLDVRLDGVAADAARAARARRRQRRGDPRRGRGLPQRDRSAGDVETPASAGRRGRSGSAASCAASATSSDRTAVVGISTTRVVEFPPCLRSRPTWSTPLTSIAGPPPSGLRRWTCPRPSRRCGATAASASSNSTASIRPRRRPPCRARTGTSPTVTTSTPAVVHDVFDELNAAFYGETVAVDPPGHARRRRRSWSPTRCTATTRRRSRGWSSTPARTARSPSSSGSSPTATAPRSSCRAVRARPAGGAGHATSPSTSSAPSVWQLGHQQAIGERDSTTLLATVALGGDYARVRTDAKLVGQGASTRQVALYFADGTQMHDFRTLQDHVAPRTTSDLLFKGAVQDTARSVYTGLIRIGQEAKGIDRLPDQPQPHAQRGRLGRERAQPRDRDQRREVQPRRDRRPDRRGAALLPREPRHPARDRRAAGRARASSTRCSTSCRCRPLRRRAARRRSRPSSTGR